MSTLYVTEPGAVVEREYRHLLVTRHDETLLRVPLADVTHVVLMGAGASATTPALHALLGAGIPLSLLRQNGELLGRLAPRSGGNLALRRSQYRYAADPARCLAVGRAVARGKLRNCRALALRWTRAGRDGEAAAGLARMEAALAEAEGAGDLAALRGVEGAGSKAYFAVFRRQLRGDVGFGPRTRRPPRDPVNALLSLGYTLLGEAAAAALEVVGLDPYEGFYHADKYGRPALALDLIEEFRAPVVDSVALTLVNNRRLAADDFTPNPGTGGVYLTPRGLRVFLEAFSGRMQARFTHPLAGRPLTYQKCLEAQARLLAKTVTGELPEYHPLRVR